MMENATARVDTPAGHPVIGTVIAGLPDQALAPAATLLAPIIPLLGAVLAAILLYRSTIGVARRNLLVGTVTKERAQWREDMRLAVSRLVAVAAAMPSSPSREQMAEFDRLRVEIRLRLNPSRMEKDFLDQHILEALKELRSALLASRIVHADLQIETIERSVQQLIKNEWEVSKHEARSGKLKVRG